MLGSLLRQECGKKHEQGSSSPTYSKHLKWRDDIIPSSELIQTFEQEWSHPVGM